MIRIKAIHRLYLQQFLLTSGLFFLISWGFYLFRVSAPLLWELFARSLFFGLLMSWFTISGYVKGLKKDGLEVNAESLGARACRTVLVGKPKQELLEHFRNHPIFGNSAVREIPSGLEILTGARWSGMGQKIRLCAEERSGKQTRLRVSSEPRFPLTLLDDGTNRKNVERIVALIKPSAPNG